jgi:ppGpp synthetase/RelA/SpoT-type nucleotidyltranferase
LGKLGERIGRAAAPDPALLEGLQSFRATFDEPLALAQGIVTSTLAVETTSRIKTVNTIVEKLKRAGTRLSKMQDIGGIRAVLDCGLHEQDDAVARLAGALGNTRIVDLRKETRHGYRAVHVITTIGRSVLEVQVRTRLQDLWAQGMEKLADRVGRGIRYGEPARIDNIQGTSVHEVLEMARGLSASVREHEETLLRFSEIERDYRELESANVSEEDLKTRSQPKGCVWRAFVTTMPRIRRRCRTFSAISQNSGTMG